MSGASASRTALVGLRPEPATLSPPSGDHRLREMVWEKSDRFDPRAVALADRHYSRQKPGTPQFMKPGSCCVFYAKTESGEAVWGTSWQQHAKHAWPGAWECAIFRNEGAGRSSDLIRQAVAATRAHYGEPPEQGMITFIDSSRVRRKRDPGRCFVRAGFRPCGDTAGGLRVLRLAPRDMPPACAPFTRQFSMLMFASCDSGSRLCSRPGTWLDPEGGRAARAAGIAQPLHDLPYQLSNSNNSETSGDNFINSEGI